MSEWDQIAKDIDPWLELEEDRDSYRSYKINPIATEMAHRFLNAVRKRDESLVPYHVAPVCDGGIWMDWCGRIDGIEVDITVAISGNAELGYLLLDSERNFEEERNMSFDDLLSLVIGLYVNASE